jgi:ElaB/YqjD/DUF883 family membrane-anchored ribosome-binding protein
MSEANSEGAAAGSVAAAALDKAANVAHSAVDKVIGAAVPAAQWVDQKTMAQQERLDATAEYVKQNPGRALAMAFVAGLLIGKILL